MSESRLWNRWDEVDPLLERALDHPADRCDAFLVDASGGDPELLALLRRLVEQSRAPEPRFFAPPALLRAALTEPRAPVIESPEALVGRTIGSYRLERVLGIGGMGTVYLASRVDGVFQRRVAIKVLRPSLAVSDLPARFHQERQILATLSHAGIAQMIDGGVTDDGRSWLAMEHVDGVAIDQYANEHELDVEARIRLVLQAADAVDHAHRHMVVHRDLKPSNMLVTDAGVVKLLDFGIAKLLRAQDPPDSSPDAPPTRQESRFVTPEYAAPEQVLGGTVTTQTDVYGLAAVLYELLTGTRVTGRRDAQAVLERVLAGDEPAAPSAVVRRPATRGPLTAAGDTAPAPVGLRPDALRRRLTGDLDAILLRALRPRPEERYPSVAALRDDLERHLSGRPVLARGNARVYRIRRFVRRHRVSVSVAAAALLLVTGSAVGLAVQRGALLDERNRATAAAQDAAREAETARQVTALVVGLFEGGDARADDDTLTVAALLDRGALRVDTDLAGQPAVRAALLDVLGRVYGNLGRYAEAADMLQRAVALRADTLPDRTGLAASLSTLGKVYSDEREFDAAVIAYRRAMQEAERAGEHAIAAEARLGMANAWLLHDATDSAEVAFRSGIALLSALPEPPEGMYLNALLGLAGLLRRSDDLEGAATLYGQVVDHRRSMPEPDAMALAVSLNNLAVTRRMQGRFEDAAALYGEAHDTAVAVLGAGHPTTLMFAGNLANAWHGLGRHDLCLVVYRARVEAARAQWPDGHWRLASMLMNLGAEQVLTGNDEHAIDALAEAVAMLEVELGPDHEWTAVYRGWLAAATTLAGNGQAGGQVFDRSIDALSRYEGLADDREVNAMLAALVGALEQRGLAAQATRYGTLLENSRVPAPGRTAPD